jgi:CBS domain-containing protein
MDKEPRTVHPDTPTVEAIRSMRENRLACLPVVREGKLVGIVTEHDFIKVASRLLETHLSPGA